MASGQKFVALSRQEYGRLPTTWQTEFTDQVTWCNSATRISPAQKKPATAPDQVPETRPPMPAGTSSETATSAPENRPMTCRSRSARRSGANLDRLLSSRFSIQPTWA
jgi:hypothetical protein